MTPESILNLLFCFGPFLCFPVFFILFLVVFILLFKKIFTFGGNAAKWAEENESMIIDSLKSISLEDSKHDLPNPFGLIGFACVSYSGGFSQGTIGIYEDGKLVGVAYVRISVGLLDFSSDSLNGRILYRDKEHETRCTLKGKKTLVGIDGNFIGSFGFDSSAIFDADGKQIADFGEWGPGKKLQVRENGIPIVEVYPYEQQGSTTGNLSKVLNPAVWDLVMKGIEGGPGFINQSLKILQDKSYTEGAKAKMTSEEMNRPKDKRLLALILALALYHNFNAYLKRIPRASRRSRFGSSHRHFRHH